MELFELKTNIRETRGKNAARVIRNEGRVPAVVYGDNMDAVAVDVLVADVEEAFKQSETIQVVVNLKVGDAEPKVAIIKDVQTDPTRGEFRHVDFQVVALDKKIKAVAPVETVGKAAGLEMGGILQVIRRQLDVLCLPLAIPTSIKVDVTDLKIGKSIHVDEIKIDGVEIPHNVNFTVVTVVPPKGMSLTDEEEGEAGEEEA
ncbi:50S ribosomal protein L25 [Desulfoluna butyratoxydans]|uniref:Large ribosomal subunit protein bL25 n=1 Tax=Desulfoluna butyratoxydans TaxID=231438 RepID=A0A4U8YPN5_9BACT|nr:50S ribosomal protein L25 [Desulfoluna butyratoxydans]VFQ45740.1 ribosomal protein l25 long-form [Desulfoluna butyratoxydans]